LHSPGNNEENFHRRDAETAAQFLNSFPPEYFIRSLHLLHNSVEKFSNFGKHFGDQLFLFL